MNKTKILIAGWLWFIWINISKYLLSKWHTLIIIDDLSSSSIDNRSILKKSLNYTYINKNICDLDINYKLFKNIKIIYNFATIA